MCVRLLKWVYLCCPKKNIKFEKFGVFGQKVEKWYFGNFVQKGFFW